MAPEFELTKMNSADIIATSFTFNNTMGDEIQLSNGDFTGADSDFEFWSED